VALAPDHPYDTPVIDTGSIALLPNGTAFAIYATGNSSSIQANGTYDGNICVAVSEDSKLIKWRKLGPVIDNPTPGLFPGMMSRFGFRDPTTPWLAPCPAREGAECWHVLIGSGGVVDGKGRNAALLYVSASSTDVASWSYHGIAFRDTAQNTTSGQYQYSCPDFFRLPPQVGGAASSPPQWAFMYLNPTFGGLDVSGTNKYFVGTLVNNTRFEPNGATGSRAGSFGHVIAKTARTSERAVLWGSVSLDIAPVPNAKVPAVAHGGGVMSLPKDLSLGDDGYLVFAFAPELTRLREVGSGYESTRAIPLKAAFGLRGLQMEALLVFEATNTTAPFGVRLHGDNSTVAEMAYDPGKGALCIERSLSQSKRVCVPHTLGVAEPLSLHLILDGPILELIANQRSPSEAQIWPPTPNGFQLAAFGGTAVASARMWHLQPLADVGKLGETKASTHRWGPQKL